MPPGSGATEPWKAMPDAKTADQWQVELARVGLEVGKAEKRRQELKDAYVEARKHVRHLQRERKQLLDLLVLKAKRVDELLLSSDDDDLPETSSYGFDASAFRSGGLSKAPASGAAKSGGSKKLAGGSSAPKKKSSSSRPSGTKKSLTLKQEPQYAMTTSYQAISALYDTIGDEAADIVM